MIDVLSMLVTDVATFKDFHPVETVPNVKEISDFLNVIFHLWNGVATGVVDRVSTYIHLELQCTSSISSLTTAHLNNHEHVMQMERLHVLVDCLLFVFVCTSFQ